MNQIRRAKLDTASMTERTLFTWSPPFELSLMTTRRIPKKLRAAETKPLMDSRRMEKTTRGAHKKKLTTRRRVDCGCMV